MNRSLTQERLHEVLDYNPSTGIFTNKIQRRGKVKAGEQAGYLKKNNYITIGIDGQPYQAHRLAWLYVHGYFPEGEVDHKDRVRNNNRINNLREVSRQCNIRNTGLSVANTSGVKGIYYFGRVNKWCSRIKINQKTVNLGYYEDFSEAVKARWEAEKKYNFPNCCTDSSAYQYLKSNNII